MESSDSIRDSILSPSLCIYTSSMEEKNEEKRNASILSFFNRWICAFAFYGRLKMKRRYLKGSMTIEAAFVIPFIFLILMELITSFFFYHDKNILNGAAYETAVVGSTKMREKNFITENITEL